MDSNFSLQALWEKKKSLPRQSRLNAFYDLCMGLKGRWLYSSGLFFFSLLSLCTLFFVGGLFLFLSSVGTSIARELPTQVSLQIILEDDVTKEEVTSIALLLKNTTYKFYTKEDALKKVASKLSLKNESISFLELDNPLPSYLQVFAKNEEALKQIRSNLQGLSGVKRVEIDESILSFFGTISKKGSYIALLVFGAVILIEVVFVSLIILLLFYVYREEVLIQKFFGGLDLHVMAPFILDGVLLGVLCSAVGSAASCIFISFSNEQFITTYLNIPWICSMSIFTGVCTSTLASSIASRVFLASHRGFE